MYDTPLCPTFREYLVGTAQMDNLECPECRYIGLGKIYIRPYCSYVCLSYLDSSYSLRVLLEWTAQKDLAGHLDARWVMHRKLPCVQNWFRSKMAFPSLHRCMVLVNSYNLSLIWNALFPGSTWRWRSTWWPRYGWKSGELSLQLCIPSNECVLMESTDLCADSGQSCSIVNCCWCDLHVTEL